MFICPFTGLTPIEAPKQALRSNPEFYWYHVPYNNGKLHFRICRTFYGELTNDQSEIRRRIEKSRGVLLREFLKDDFKLIQENILHWDCVAMAKAANNFLFKPFLEELESKIPLMVTRREKSEGLILHYYEQLKGDETLFPVENSLSLWASLGFNSFDELRFYLRQLSDDGHIRLSTTASGRNQFQFTLPGLEYCERLLSSKGNQEVLSVKYDIGLSFAGEQRKYVEGVAKRLSDLGLKVFYDDYEKISLWGKDLYQHLSDVYQNKCNYCIIFISKEYAEKLWTQHELRNAQARAFKENREYILPVRFDNTVLPGMTDTIGYKSASKYTPEQIADLAHEKLMNGSKI
jgi:hypothetical protein